MQMTTFSGRRVDPCNVNITDINITDIAHSLSLLCRFGGHSKEFYSVAQHCVRVSQALPPAFRLEGLLHDATEAYIQDIIRPVKVAFPGYKALEHSIWLIIAQRFHLPRIQSELVEIADNCALKSELVQFVNNYEQELSRQWWGQYTCLPLATKAWTPTEAKAFFLLQFAEAVALRAEYLQKSGTACDRCVVECHSDCMHRRG